MAGSEKISVTNIKGGIWSNVEDNVAIEEPMGIKVVWHTETGRSEKDIAVTMRTPGNDDELAVGFLFTEGIINHNMPENIKEKVTDNQIIVTLQKNIYPSLPRSDRNFFTTSACGICGKASIDSIITVSVFSNKCTLKTSVDLLYTLPAILSEKQKVFNKTGGLHACALFTPEGEFVELREDIGRHNALDKLIGSFFLKNEMPLSKYILLLSGRASFELIQKAVMAGIGFIASIGAPSSLAIELAKERGITLIGFLTDNRFNCYSGNERII